MTATPPPQMMNDLLALIQRLRGGIARCGRCSSRRCRRLLSGGIRWWCCRRVGKSLCYQRRRFC